MNLALFDFDHTLTTVDSYGRFLRQIARPEQLARARWQVGPWLAGYRIASYPVVYAYGDSSEDRDMLALAHKRWFLDRWID